MQKRQTTSQPSLDELLERLRLFNEKADKLSRSSFVVSSMSRSHGFRIRMPAGGPADVEGEGADEEATDALSLTLRFFFHERDKIALKQIKELYKSLPLTDEEKVKVSAEFKGYEAFLTTTSLFDFQGMKLTNWQIIETVLYGDLAHANPEKREPVPEVDGCSRIRYHNQVPV